MLEIDLIQVKGKTEPEMISTMVGDEVFRRSERFAALAERHAAMVAAYRDRLWDETGDAARACCALAEGLRIDGLYQLYLDRAEEFTRTPPPPDRAGVYVATSK